MCLCGCGQEVKVGRKYVHGHNPKKGRKLSKETRKRMSERKRGFNNPNFKHGKDFILNEHHKHKKQECHFRCESQFYVLHHEPEIDYNKILTWEGRLVNLCKVCHTEIHRGILKLPDNVGVSWTKKDTERALKGVLWMESE